MKLPNILEISNWDQLVRARSDNYNNLRITVTEYSSPELTGTKINVIDIDRDDIYFSTMVTEINSTIIPENAMMSNNAAVDMLNKYGFNVRLSVPTVLADSVVTILRGLYEGGYRYVYRNYIPCLPIDANVSKVYVSKDIKHRFGDTAISNFPEYIEDEWEWCEAFTTYPIKDLIDSGTVNNGLPLE